MRLYDGIKDVAKIVQKANDIELYKKLIDLSAQALDMQSKIEELSKENKKLKEKENISKKIVRHKEMYITLKKDENNVMYCSCCWDNSDKLIQLEVEDEGDYHCHICKNQVIYDKYKYNRYIKSMESDNGSII